MLNLYKVVVTLPDGSTRLHFITASSVDIVSEAINSGYSDYSPIKTDIALVSAA